MNQVVTVYSGETSPEFSLKDLDIDLVEATSSNEALKATLHHDFTLALLIYST